MDLRIGFVFSLPVIAIENDQEAIKFCSDSSLGEIKCLANLETFKADKRRLPTMDHEIMSVSGCQEKSFFERLFENKHEMNNCDD